MCSGTGDQVDPMTGYTIGTRVTEQNLGPCCPGLYHIYEINPQNRKKVDYDDR